MTLRISIDEGQSGRIIHLEGRFTREEVSELEGVLGVGGAPDRLDLLHLQSVDAEGLSALRRLRAEGMVMIGASHALAWKLDEDLA